MPEVAFATFNTDIGRADALLQLARLLPQATAPQLLVKTDIFRSAWMFGVGAMDAYFCDAYADVIAATLISKSREPAVGLPEFVNKIYLPVVTILSPYPIRANWRWRMAARAMMEDVNALKLDTIKGWFNRFFRDDQRFFIQLLPAWISHQDTTARLFGMTGGAFAATHGQAREAARQRIRRSFETRIEAIVQRRHDCIHNCDRPKLSPQRLDSWGTVRNVLTDVRFFVSRCDSHIDAEFSHWLRNVAGFSAFTASQMGY